MSIIVKQSNSNRKITKHTKISLFTDVFECILLFIKKKYTQLTIAIIVFNFIHFDESECLFILFHTSNVVVFFSILKLYTDIFLCHTIQKTKFSFKLRFYFSTFLKIFLHSIFIKYFYMYTF